jgi:hypothetical protein
VTKDSGNRESFTSGMVRDSREGKGRYDLLSPLALRRIALLLERGASKYEARNWEQGSPFCRFLDSALRHTEQYLEGLGGEDHLAAACFNLMAVIHLEELGRTDLDDRPKWATNVKHPSSTLGDTLAQLPPDQAAKVAKAMSDADTNFDPPSDYESHGSNVYYPCLCNDDQARWNKVYHDCVDRKMP